MEIFGCTILQKANYLRQNYIYIQLCTNPITRSYVIMTMYNKAPFNNISVDDTDKIKQL